MKLYKHQQDIIDADPMKCGLFLGTGSGKTMIALTLARGKTLVIAPKTQVEDKNWEREYNKHNFNIELTVISKETFRRDWKLLPRFDTLIVDESHTCLGATPNIRWVKKQPVPKTSQLFEALEAFIRLTKPDRLYLATATIIRSPMTVWAASRLLGKTWDFYQFRGVFYTRLPMPGREVWQAKSDPATKDRLAKAVRSLGYTGRLEDYFDVPQQLYKTIHVDLTIDQKKRIKELQFEYPEPIVRCGKRHQVENGVLSADEFSPAEVYSNGKLDAIEDLAIEFPRMIIFAKYKAQIEQIKKTLKDYKVLTLTGDTKDRGALIAEARASEKCIMICQAQISAGWEWPECECMVFASMTYSVVDKIQGEGRIQRANAIKRNIYIYLVSRGGVDEEVYKCLINKKDFIERTYVNK